MNLREEFEKEVQEEAFMKWGKEKGADKIFTAVYARWLEKRCTRYREALEVFIIHAKKVIEDIEDPEGGEFCGGLKELVKNGETALKEE